MADEAPAAEEEVLETPEIEEVEQPEVETPVEEEAQTAEDEGEEEVSIGFEDEPEEESDSPDDSPTIKRIRERNREVNKRNRELERELAELRAGSVQAKPALGPKPTLESCDWDEEKFEAALDTWKSEQAEAQAQTERAEEGKRKVLESYNRDLEAYKTRQRSLGVADYEEAEAVVVGALNLEQQAVALQAANDPAALVYALSKSPAKLSELAKIDNPWKLAAAIARMEGSVKVVTRKKAPNIDRPVKGSASMQSLTQDEQLAKLEKEADATGDRTKLIAYKRSLKAKV
jgi:hypothetical protein